MASPAGFPFQVLSIPNTLSDPKVYADRCRQCDLGYLREAYEKADGSLGWRCRSEEPETFVRKGGYLEETEGRKCLCNSLMANIGMGQLRKKKGSDIIEEELPLVTCGADLSTINHLTSPEKTSFSAAEVLDYIL